MGLSHFFTGRALRNIDLLLDSAKSIGDPRTEKALLLCLTSALGQMSRMVFAITARGKTTGRPTNKIEVGSWTVGYWRPTLHFELNVWDCFSRRVSRFLKACRHLGSLPLLHGNGNGTQVTLLRGDCLQEMTAIDDCSVDLVVTDPPHGDRIPYLELSELWNAVLGEHPDFENEIVVSNALGREKTSRDYACRLQTALDHCGRLLKPNGHLVLLFNSRKESDWTAVRALANRIPEAKQPLHYHGSFDCTYSAGSVVQDNRAGGLKSDLGLVFSKVPHDRAGSATTVGCFRTLPGWSTRRPRQFRGIL